LAAPHARHGIVAAKTASCRYLLTEDLQEGQDMDGVVVVNPFRNSPDEFAES
jgi:predicted nucleic acid-binding protein